MSRRRYKAIALISGLLVVGLVVGVGLNMLSNSRRIQVFGELVQRVETTDKVVALTFDDDPTPGDTESVLQVLADYDVTATFFLNGVAMQDHPAQTRAIVSAGHQVGNHAWWHRQMWFLTAEEVRADLDDTDAEIRAAGHQGAIDFHPPYGKKLFVLPRVLQERGTRTITWDVSPEDFSGVSQTPEQLRDIVMDTVRPGSIILLHPMEERVTTQAATALTINALQQDGYRFVSVQELTRNR